jgi:hypothetical protein
MDMKMNGIDEFQRMGKDNMELAMKSFGEVNKGFQAIATEMTDYSKKAFEEGTATFEKLAGARSVEQAVEIQTEYAKKSYEGFVSQASRIGEMYVELAKGMYKPVETAIAKKA